MIIMISFCCGKNVGMPFEGEREGEVQVFLRLKVSIYRKYKVKFSLHGAMWDGFQIVKWKIFCNLEIA